jgi:hypothetical protein
MGLIVSQMVSATPVQTVKNQSIFQNAYERLRLRIEDFNSPAILFTIGAG